MTTDGKSGTQDRLIVRNRVNMVAGLVIQAILLGIWILNDPLELWSSVPPSESATWAESVVMVLLMALVGIASMALFWYPHVQVEPARIVVYNPISTVIVPREAISEVDTTARHVRIRANGRMLRCWGLETSLWMQLTHNDKAWKLRIQPVANRTGTIESAADLPQRQWRRPSVPEVIVGGGWLVLLVVSMIYG
ncbi:hypothetical protein [Kribbella sp. NPDC000426]|uniref:hypothetical protein n=1 Tax=Kribbella sp. NPDC000426 TaxID=3154255 RepID=UPI0033256BB5